MTDAYRPNKWGFMFSWKEIGRKELRLKGYDYSQPGYYFINPVTEDRIEWFGVIREVGVDPCVDPRTNPPSIMELNEYGMIVDKFWNKLPEKFPGIRIHEFVTMPNHFHGIIEIVSRVRNEKRSTLKSENGSEDGKGSTHGSTPTAAGTAGYGEDASAFKGIPDFVQWFKTMTTNAFYNEYAKGHRFGKVGRIGKLWQRDYYEHIIRGKSDLKRIQEYIRENPAKWERDRNNPNPHPNIT